MPLVLPRGCSCSSLIAAEIVRDWILVSIRTFSALHCPALFFLFGVCNVSFFLFLHFSDEDKDGGIFYFLCRGPTVAIHPTADQSAAAVQTAAVVDGNPSLFVSPAAAAACAVPYAFVAAFFVAAADDFSLLVFCSSFF